MLGIEGISALRGVNLTIKEKEFVCIFGTSGGGKTTMLNIIGTIDKPTKVLKIKNWQKYVYNNSIKLCDFDKNKVLMVFAFVREKLYYVDIKSKCQQRIKFSLV